MTSYPITISAQTIDMAGAMGTQGGMRSGRSEAEEARSGVYADYSEIEASEAMAGNIKENNLTAFRQYLNDPGSEIWQYLGENGVVYSYNVSFSVYSYDRDVLIAFVAVSLVVSCIMIGIITHISVLERTKEIGILRALGASKQNISHVFNAETLIIGLCAGVLGVGISILLSFPINSIIQNLLGAATLSASLPVVSALLLVALSMVITLIGGLIPAKRAARKDPVTALRTE